MSYRRRVVTLGLCFFCWTLSAGSDEGPRTLPPEEERKANCPSTEQLGDLCSCWTTTFGGLYIECTGLESRVQLRAAFSALDSQPLFGLGLHNSSLSHLPSGLLSGGLQALYLRHTRLAALRGPGPSPFQLVAETLVHLDIQGEQSAWTWRWMDLAPLTRIRTLNVRQSDVRSLDRGVSLGLSPVRYLSFVDCRIDHLTDLVFSSLGRLTILDLSQNLIPRLTRSMLPQAAPNLVTINLRRNRLNTLEKGTFDGLDGLKVLDLGFNRLSTLEQATFRPILMNVKKHVYLEGNPLSCDCRLRWMLRSGKSEATHHLRKIAAGATCSRPLELEERILDGLRAHELASCRDHEVTLRKKIDHQSLLSNLV